MAQDRIRPNPGLRELHGLLGRLRSPENPIPSAQTLDLRLVGAIGEPRVARIAVSQQGDADSAGRGHIHADGSFVVRGGKVTGTIIALRNLAADPVRRFSRYGQETSGCPFCNDRLGHGELAAVIGYCRTCAQRLGWPHDQRAATRAEDALRREVIREIESEDSE